MVQNLGVAANRWVMVCAVLGMVVFGGGCSDAPWNDPYPYADHTAEVIYSAFGERPKHLDPVRSYSANEYRFIAQIYEPPLQYHFLSRPYRLVPLTAVAVPEPHYYGQDGNELPADAPIDSIAWSEYRIEIQPGIRYQPHPAFATDESGRYIYHDLGRNDLIGKSTLFDFEATATRELTADDYIYQIKRLAAPWLQSPIAGIMRDHIEDFAELSARIEKRRADATKGEWIDLRAIEFAGAEVMDRYTYCVRLRGKYPQFLYWLAMPFFAPMPWEAELFYSQPGMDARNITLDWYPVGTGAFMLSENNPNLRMVLDRNPNHHAEFYPTTGMPEDIAAGLLADAGRSLPMIERAIYSLEKESIPYWNKFLQGYYDFSGIASDAFDQAVSFNALGDVGLTQAMIDQGIELTTAVEASVYYLGFNMVDPVLGGDSERARLLRQAISIAVDFEEFISIFLNGRGVSAQGPIPPGIFGHREGREGINPHVYEWHDGRPVRRGLADARELMDQAGYPDGRDPQTGKALTVTFEAVSRGPGDNARFNWLRKQFAKLGIQLIIRATDYNRFQEKMRKGTGQTYLWGWNADYPDPENMLFLLYGPNSKVEHGGENSSNYANSRFDALFDRMKNMDNGPERQAIIDDMVRLFREDAPWAGGFYPKAFSLHHTWVSNVKPNLMANNTLKYVRVDPATRASLRQAWNRPILWPIWATLSVLILAVLPAFGIVLKRERSRAL